MSAELIIGGFGQIDNDLPVFTSSGWEDHLQAWIDAESDVTSARWRQAAVAHSLVTQYGDRSVEKFAESIGIAARRVWEYRTVYAIAIAWSKNSDRPQNLSFSHFIVAASAPNPHEYLEQASRDQLSTRALRRLITQQTAPPMDAPIPALSDDPAIVAAWHNAQVALNALKAAAPRLSAQITGFVEEIQYELSCPAETIHAAILAAIGQGLDTVDLLAQHLRQHRDHVTVWLNRLEELGEVEHDERRVGARGPAETWWRLKSEW